MLVIATEDAFTLMDMKKKSVLFSQLTLVSSIKFFKFFKLFCILDMSQTVNKNVPLNIEVLLSYLNCC